MFNIGGELLLIGVVLKMIIVQILNSGYNSKDKKKEIKI